MAEPDDKTVHMAGVCSACDAAFVALTLGPKGKPVEVVVNRLKRLTCPDCGGRKIMWGIKEHHARAVARLRAEAALD